ncbi:tail assembly protein [Burkholderia phage BcepNazgul]|uniref:Conserved tail assembly protein n=1 Tax=Burkholderia phage BcepNazgul TaxID=242861 RepID=Q6UYJ4_9CAUD|nr:tail assembly protein [Burkholderia phage BcepNazgul]AAQ63347.1 conserved tail assembly protein [Burkholderia phage BcepNazgul]
MPNINLPVWSSATEWSGGVLEALEWATSVQQSNMAAEQRRSLRISPRRFFETSVLVIDAERTRLNAALTAGGGTSWNVPLPWDLNPLTASAQVGDTVVYVEDTTTSELKKGGLVFFRGRTSFDYEVRLIADMTATTITLDQGLVQAWPKGTKLLPIQEAMLTDQPQMTRKADRAAVYAINWQVTETNDYPEAAWTDIYRGYPVFRLRPDDTSDLTVQYSRLLDVLDSGYGIPKRGDTAGIQLYAQQFAFFAHGRQQNADLRGLLYALRGRVTPFWLPSHAADMQLAKPIQSGDTTITIKRSGLADFFSTLPDGQQDIILDPRRSTVPAMYRRVLGVTLDQTTGNEIVTVDAAFTQAVFASDLKRVSFMTLARLNQDRVEINHMTDTKGVSSAVVTFQSTPENRVATNYDITRYTQTTQTPDPCICGSECGAWGDVRTNGRPPVDPLAGEYPKTESANLNATYDIMVASGYTPDQAEATRQSTLAAMNDSNNYTRDYMLLTIQGTPWITTDRYAYYASLDDATLHAAFRVFLAYNIYSLLYSLLTGGLAYAAAKSLTTDITECAQDDSASETLLATACAAILESITSASSVQAQTTSSTGSIHWWVDCNPPMVAGMRGATASIVNAAAIEADPNGSWMQSIVPAFDNSIASGLMQAAINSIDVLLGGKAGSYIQAGCGAVPLQISELKTQANDVLNPTAVEGGHYPAGDVMGANVWGNLFTAAFLDTVQWPAKVKMRQRDVNGTIVQELVFACYNIAIPNTGIYLNILRAYPYMTYRWNPNPGTGVPSYYPNPKQTEWFVFKNTGNFVFDFLAADPNADISVPTHVVNQEPYNGGGVFE